jgi:carboxylesterase type B
MPHLTRALALLFFVLSGVTAAAQQPNCPVDEPEVACTQQGAVRGVIEGDMLAFKNIPYARPPVGPLRWKPTEPAQPWSGVRDGSRFGPICPQIIAQEVAGEEDCLTINVWRPRVKPAQALPVMVWLTGGGNHSLSGQGSAGFGGVTYTGEKLVPHGVVFVSYNLRLGVLGFSAGQVIDEASYAAALERVFGTSSRERILATYPVKSYPAPGLAFVQATTDAEFTYQSRRVARTFSKAQNEPVYRYLFTQAQENDPALKAAGVAHTVEHAFLFPGKYQHSPAEVAIQNQMAGYWTRMARNGNPNGGNDPLWPESTVDNDAYLEIGAATAPKSGPADAQCDFWDTITLPVAASLGYTSQVKDRIKSMSEAMPNVAFIACGNTQQNMKKAEAKDIPLISQAKLVDSGVVRLMELQEKGWSYIRP